METDGPLIKNLKTALGNGEVVTTITNGVCSSDVYITTHTTRTFILSHDVPLNESGLNVSLPDCSMITRKREDALLGESNPGDIITRAYIKNLKIDHASVTKLVEWLYRHLFVDVYGEHSHCPQVEFIQDYFLEDYVETSYAGTWRLL
jgi:hypothetical protein